MKLAEMREAEVDFISLVPTGANGQPIKRLKSEGEGSDMIDMRRIFKQEPELDSPELLAVVVSEKGNLDAAKTILKAAGVEIAEEREHDGGMLLLTDENISIDTGAADVVVERLTGEMVAVCKVSKTFAPYDGGTNFTEAAKGQGYFPALRGALETFGEVTFNIMAESKSPEEAAEAVKQATKEFSSLVTSMTAALPVSVFKMDAVIKATANLPEGSDEPKTEKVEKDDAEKAKVDAEKVEKTEKVEKADDADAEGKDKVKKVDNVTVTVNAVVSPPSPDAAIEPDPKQAEFDSEDGVDTGAVQSVNKDDDADADADADADDAEVEDAGLTQVLKALEGLGEKVADVSSRLDTVSEQSAETREKADAAEAAVKGTVVSDSPTDRHKSDGGMRGTTRGGPALMDTGMRKTVR